MSFTHSTSTVKERWPWGVDLRTFSASEGRDIVEEVVNNFMEVNPDTVVVYIVIIYPLIMQYYMPNIKLDCFLKSFIVIAAKWGIGMVLCSISVMLL